MKFTPDNVELPRELIAALAENKLVIFVGAGVSARAYPNQKVTTYYPNFSELVTKVGERVGFAISNEEEVRLKNGGADRVLGDWVDHGAKIHAESAHLLTENESHQRLELHRSIIRLFPKGAEPRLVTTNFDRLLIRSSAHEHGCEIDNLPWPIHIAPALPPAGRFSGLCFLHGVVDEPNEMVLTDKDIGRAYMDEGWALKFTHEMFRRFNVLFIGYSLEDPPLRYLSLALEGNNDRKHWVFLSRPKKKADKEKQEQSWRRRGVVPIWFDAPRKDYRAIERTLDEWGKENKLGFLDSKNLAVEYGKTEVSQLEPFKLDRMRRLLKDRDLLRDFAKSKPHTSWFELLSELGLLEAVLHERSFLSTQADIELADIIANWLVTEPEVWVPKLMQYKMTVSQHLINIVFSKIQEDQDKDNNIPIETLVWLYELFRERMRQGGLIGNVYGLYAILKKAIEGGRGDIAIDLFLALVEPELNIKREKSIAYVVAKSEGIQTDKYPEFETRAELVQNTQNGDYQAREIFSRLIIQNIETIGVDLILLITMVLTRSVKRIRKSYIEVGDTSKIRPAIEKHKANEHRNEAVGLLVDLAIEAWQGLLEVNVEKAKIVHTLWRNSPDPIVERLGIHTTRMLLEYGA